MRIIKVSAIDSTNSFVRKFYEGKMNFEPVCVRAISQTQGRGQRGAAWLSKPGENLTFSILYPQKDLQVSSHFTLSACIALAVLDVLREEKVPGLKLKWPNDILSARHKIGGILIENILKASHIVASVIGVGINVNQTEFGELTQASSLSKATGKSFNLDSLLGKLVSSIESRLDAINKIPEKDILQEYTNDLFRLDQVSVFSTAGGDIFNAIIRGVTGDGRLKLEIEDSGIKTFDLKEVQLQY